MKHIRTIAKIYPPQLAESSKLLIIGNGKKLPTNATKTI